MPDNIVVTLRTEKPPGAVWPVLRAGFAWIGFAVVAVVGLSIVNAPNPPQKASEVIEALREGWRAYEAAYRANPSSKAADDDYGKAPDDRAPIIEPLQ
jgi:hypothetical protein